MKQHNKGSRLGDYVYRVRKERGISTQQLADGLGIHRSALDRIQLGVRNPRPQLLARLAEALDVNVGELYALAGYRTEQEMPDLRGWLHIKHRSLPTEDVEALQGHLDFLIDKNERNQQRKENPNE